MNLSATDSNTEMRLCTCGAKPAVRRETRHGADGKDEVIYRVACPVCGQLGPAIPASGEEGAARDEAVNAWNTLIARTRPSES